MLTSPWHCLKSAIGLAFLGLTVCIPAASADSPGVISPGSLPAVSTVDQRFQSYNIEMLEVTGGRFWKPYKAAKAASPASPNPASAGTPAAGIAADLYQYRPPIDLTQPKLRKLAAALGPVYLRVSGTWANSTYFQDSTEPASTGSTPVKPPTGFNGVLTRDQWKGVVEFAHAVNAEIITSFAMSEGTRDAKGDWKPDQARALLSYTKSIGGRIAAAAFMNEPNFADRGGAPKWYDANAYAKDIAAFRAFLKQAAPGVPLLGPESVLEGGTIPVPPNSPLNSESLYKATGPAYDIFTYHLYAALSQRCAAGMPAAGTSRAAALSEEWLSRSSTIHAYYAGLRDRFDPGKPLWLTETADAGCGGDPWASTFLDTFRYLEQHAALAQKGVRVIAHNTLSASDYGLLDENTFDPRPNYWAALLWNRLMGTTVLKPEVNPTPGLHVFAQCMKNAPGGVTILAMNTDRSTANSLQLAKPSERYSMTAPNLEQTRVDLNGKELKLGTNDAIPTLSGARTPSGRITLAPASITFLAVRDAHNASCR